ncbi:MAG: hypothetical protein FGM15_12030 [Chthoniobacterales bacterium]|nr:hypothetical protein [Chthoniobacterales bacterium]
MTPQETRPKSLLVVTSLLLLAASSALAQTTRTWDAGASTSDLLTALNWSGDAVPGNTSIALFDGTVGGDLSLTFGAAFGGSTGLGITMTNTQTGNLTINNSSATQQTIRIDDTTTYGIKIASGAGAFTLALRARRIQCNSCWAVKLAEI